LNAQLIESFTHRVLADLAAANASVLTNVGHKLGLYRAMAGAGALTSAELYYAGSTAPCTPFNLVLEARP
jgi:hypothetical protein